MILGSFFDTLRWRIKRNKNALVIITGPTGSGKSWGALRIAEILDSTFTMDRVCFSPVEFLEMVKKHYEGEPLPEGSVIVIDEAGVQYSSRDWQGFNNRILGLLAQSFRSLNWIVIFTLPHFSYLEKQAREQAHFILNAESINFKDEMTRFALWEMRHQGNPMAKDGSLPRIPYKMEKKKMVRLKHIYIKKPSENVVLEYEWKKKGWQTKEYTNLLEKARGKSAETGSSSVPDTSIFDLEQKG